MMILKYLRTVGAAALLTTAMALPAVAQSAKAVLQDKSGKEVGTVDLLQTPAGVLLKVALKGVPAGEHAFHLHAVGKCDSPAFDSAGPHFNPTNEKHGMLSGRGHAGVDDYKSDPAGNAGPRLACGIIAGLSSGSAPTR